MAPVADQGSFPQGLRLLRAATRPIKAIGGGSGDMETPPLDVAPAGKAVASPAQPFMDVRLRHKVGQGSFGKAYFGGWLGEQVAVKDVSWRGRRGVARAPCEAGLASALSHPNLVRTFKYITKPKPRAPQADGNDDVALYHTWIVQEWCDAGTLGAFCVRPRNDPAGHVVVLQIMAEVASAVSYLHSLGIVHGDLTANNVLCQTSTSVKGFSCKVTDAAFAHVAEQESTGILIERLGSVAHMPPELLRAGAQAEFTTKADVYAAGVLLWQAVCGQIPWEGLDKQEVTARVVDGERLCLPQDAPQPMLEVFGRCMVATPGNRPSMEVLLTSSMQQLRERADAAVAPPA